MFSSYLDGTREEARPNGGALRGELAGGQVDVAKIVPLGNDRLSFLYIIM